MMTNGTEKVQFVCFSSCVFKHGAKTQQTSDLQPALIILKKIKQIKKAKQVSRQNQLIEFENPTFLIFSHETF